MAEGAKREVERPRWTAEDVKRKRAEYLLWLVEYRAAVGAQYLDGKGRWTDTRGRSE